MLLDFDAFLAERGLELEAVVIGGLALVLLGIIDRPTRDCDVLHPDLPVNILAAAEAFAIAKRKAGQALGNDWLDNGPASLTRVLEPGWRSRIQSLFRGRALRLSTLQRLDLLSSKLFALCDRLTDMDDCVAMKPSSEELLAVQPWLELQDANPDWPRHVRNMLVTLSARLGHGV